MRRYYPPLIALLASCVLMGIMHRPLWVAEGPHLPGEAGSDVLRAWWSAWLIASEIPGWPYGSTLANFPAGVDILPFPALSLIVVSPVTWIFGAHWGVTALVAFHGVLAVMGTAWLVRTLGGQWGGGVLAGCLVASAPVLGGALRDGTLEILAVGWVPLVLGAMVRAARGSTGWGVIAGVLYVCCCVESLYHASFAALAVIVALFTLRIPQGLRGVGAAGITVLAGGGILALMFWDILAHVPAALEVAGNADDLRHSNAVNLKLLQTYSTDLGARGWRVGDIYGPPAMQWAALFLGLIAALRRRWWLVVLAAMYLGLALDHPWMAWWANSPIGEVVRFPRRAMAPFAMAAGVGLGVELGTVLPWRRVELAVGCAAGLWLGWWGAAGGGLQNSYPLIGLPSPEFAAWIAEDREDTAVLFVPKEIHGVPFNLRSEAPVFAELGKSIASGDKLALQVLTDSAAWYAPSLVTVHERDGYTGALPDNLTDMSFPKNDLPLASSSVLKPRAYKAEIAWLMGEGLKYVVVDAGAYREEELVLVKETLETYAVEVRDFPNDGTGVIVYRLYDERPERVPIPARPGMADTDSSMGISGSVILPPGLAPGMTEILIHVGADVLRCPTRPESGQFACGAVEGMDRIELELDGVPYAFTKTGSDQAMVITVKP